MLLEAIKTRMFQAMKAGSIVEKEILRVAVGEITTDRAREGRKGDDAEAQGILRKLIKSNQESIAAGIDAEKRAVLEKENEVLAGFLPKSLSVAEIVAALSSVRDAVRAAGSDGQAMGVAMKHLKASGLSAGGNDVTDAVKQLRA